MLQTYDSSFSIKMIDSPVSIADVYNQTEVQFYLIIALEARRKSLQYKKD